MSEDVVLLERIDGVARIVLNRPEQRNALSIDVMERIMYNKLSCRIGER